MTTTGAVFAMNREEGITLIELAVTVSIIAILIFALGFEYSNWMGRYKAENQMKEMYIDLMNTRARAMERNRIHFVTGTANQYAIYEDTNPGPDGNGTLEPASDDRLPRYPKTVEYAMTWTGAGSQIDFDRRGIMSPSGSIYLTSSTDPAVSANRDYDCIEISQTRINMGKWDATATKCVEK